MGSPWNAPSLANKLYPEAGSGRGIGRSTGIALGYISRAILRPNTWIVVIDHIDTPRTNKALLMTCIVLVKEMNLTFFTFEYKHTTGQARIRCDIFGDTK